MKIDRLDEIERAGYLAAKNSEAKTAHMYGPREERMAFEKGYYKGVIDDGWAKRDGWNGSLKREGWDW